MKIIFSFRNRFTCLYIVYFNELQMNTYIHTYICMQVFMSEVIN